MSILLEDLEEYKSHADIPMTGTNISAVECLRGEIRALRAALSIVLNVPCTEITTEYVSHILE